jgi:predicted lipoprotein with Yx(FWY)xxD motif
MVDAPCDVEPKRGAPATELAGSKARRVVTGRSAFVLAAVAVAVAIGAAAVVLLRGSAPAPSHPSALRSSTSRLGRILVDERGRTLYLYTEDAHGRSACIGDCARVWPPVIIRGSVRPGPGVATGKLRTYRRTDSTLQVVYGGHPLYRFSGDSAPGQAGGQGFLGQWFVVSPAGRQIGRRRPGAGGYGS